MKTRAEKLAEVGLNETDEAIRLVQIYGEKAPDWAHEAVSKYLKKLNEALG